MKTALFLNNRMGETEPGTTGPVSKVRDNEVAEIVRAHLDACVEIDEERIREEASE